MKCYFQFVRPTTPVKCKQLSLHGLHACWCHCPTSKRCLLTLGSKHTIVVEMAIAFTSLKAALIKSCPPMMITRFNIQMDRLASREFTIPRSYLRVRVRLFLKILEGSRKTPERQQNKIRPAVFPHIHKVSHDIQM